MNRAWALALPAVLLPAAACSSPPSTPAGRAMVVEPRQATAGAALWRDLPAGAEIVVEVDLARLRGNPVVGDMARALLDAPPAVPGAQVAQVAQVASLSGVDLVVLAAYRVGTPEATTITIGQGGAMPAHAVALDGGRWALAAEGDVGAILAAHGDGPDLAADAELLAIRDRAMPPGADGASLRVAARLGETARAALAEALGVEDTPAVVSLWGDVADDLAVVALLVDARPGRAAPRWLPGVERLRDRLAAVPELGALGLARPIADADIRRHGGGGVRVAVVIAPGRLRRAVHRWSLATSSGVSP